jgi:AraC-like DNA-binding protein
VRTATTLASRPDFAVTAVTCRDDHTRWSQAEARDDYGIVLVRRGRFRRRAAGRSADLDPTLAYLRLPGVAEQFAHPAGGDVCTSVSFVPELWQKVAGTAEPARSVLYVDARVELAHRRVLAGTEDPDYGLAEELLRLLALAVRGRQAAPGTDPALVAAAREAVLEREPAAGGLLALADLLRVSPYRLSRAFSGELGISLTRYRNRVRVGRALDRLENGERDLAALAADLGFADQAHLTRTMRQHLGHTPAVVRGLFPTNGATAGGVTH